MSDPFFQMQTLDFRLHDFVRITWVSRPAREAWAPRFAKIRTSLSRLHDPILASPGCGRPLRLERVYPDQVARIGKRLAARRLCIERLDASAAVLSRFYPVPFPEDDRRVFLLAGKENALHAAVEALVADDFAGWHAAFGLPPCCVRFLQRFCRSGLSDPVWPIALQTLGEPDLRDEIDLPGSVETHVLLRPAGLALLPYDPCSFACERSKKLARAIAALGRRRGAVRAMDDLEEILSWPVGWSSLHGIAEIKTPVCKIIYNSDATAVKYTVRRSGARYPAEGARGRGFPYRPPERLAFSDSEAFRRGIENPLKVL